MNCVCLHSTGSNTRRLNVLFCTSWWVKSAASNLSNLFNSDYFFLRDFKIQCSYSVLCIDFLKFLKQTIFLNRFTNCMAVIWTSQLSWGSYIREAEKVGSLSFDCQMGRMAGLEWARGRALRILFIALPYHAKRNFQCSSYIFNRQLISQMFLQTFSAS